MNGPSKSIRVEAGDLGSEYKLRMVLSSQEHQIGRGEIERVGNAAVITILSSVGPRSDVVGGGSLGDIFCCCFCNNVGIVAYIELAKANGKTGRGDKWTRGIKLSEGVKLRVAPKTDGLGVKLANSRHCVLLQEM